MGERPASIYREKPGQPYTRQSQKKSDNFIKGAPASRVPQYRQGVEDGDFDTAVKLVVEKGCGIRSEALEAGRIAANSYLSKVMNPEQDYF